MLSWTSLFDNSSTENTGQIVNAPCLIMQGFEYASSGFTCCLSASSVRSHSHLKKPMQRGHAPQIGRAPHFVEFEMSYSRSRAHPSLIQRTCQAHQSLPLPSSIECLEFLVPKAAEDHGKINVSEVLSASSWFLTC